MAWVHSGAPSYGHLCNTVTSLLQVYVDCGLCMDSGYDMEVSLFGIPANWVHQKQDSANRTQQQ